MEYNNTTTQINEKFNGTDMVNAHRTLYVAHFREIVHEYQGTDSVLQYLLTAWQSADAMFFMCPKNLSF